MGKEGTSECGMLGVGGACKGGCQGDLGENGSTEHMRDVEGEEGRNFSKLKINMGCFKARLSNNGPWAKSSLLSVLFL